ncbi:MAG: hypothetical protein PsegKO_27890 [Pseudohongiellaceae bacterium]
MQQQANQEPEKSYQLLLCLALSFDWAIPMRVIRLMLTCLAITVSDYPQWVMTQDNWGDTFSKYDAEGTFVVPGGFDTATRQIHNTERATTRLSRASTFKIPHTLLALDSGAIAEEFQVFAWDDVMRHYAPQNQDQNLWATIRNSPLWVFEIIASNIGEPHALIS